MFYLFSSDFETRYKRNVLDILCYPQNHIFRFRYHVDHVLPEIQAWASQPQCDSKLDSLGRKAVTVYAETTGNVPTKKFAFYPTREVHILRIQVIGTVYYVDVRLGEFIDYIASKGNQADNFLDRFRAAIHRVPLNCTLD